MRRLRVHPRAPRRRDRRVERAGEQRRTRSWRPRADPASRKRVAGGQAASSGPSPASAAASCSATCAAEHDDRTDRGQRPCRRERLEPGARRRPRSLAAAAVASQASPSSVSCTRDTPRGDRELVDQQRPAARRAVAGAARSAHRPRGRARHAAAPPPLARSTAAGAARSPPAARIASARGGEHGDPGPAAAAARRTPATPASRGRPGAGRRSTTSAGARRASGRLSSTKRS